MHILDGKQCAHQITQEITETISSFSGRKPGLAFVLVGSNPASQVYVRMKQKACSTTGIQSTLIQLPGTIAQSDLLAQIDQLNKNPSIDAILVQLPLPSHIDEKEIMFAIDPKKDVDGFHPVNVGKLLLGDPTARIPCTPHGIQTLLIHNKIPIEGKHVVIVGRSNIVGKPLAALLVQKRAHANATVTLCHSHTTHLPSITRTADILIAALGSPHFIKQEMVKQGAVVIDVGIHRTEKGLIGDVDFQHVAPLTSAITPVPGGIGPMTIAMLLKNTLGCYYD